MFLEFVESPQKVRKALNIELVLLNIFYVDRTKEVQNKNVII